MPAVSQGNSFTLTIAVGQTFVISTVNEAVIDYIAGIQGAGFDSKRLYGTKKEQSYGPFDVPVILKINAIAGDARYEFASSTPIDLQYVIVTQAEMTAIEALGAPYDPKIIYQISNSTPPNKQRKWNGSIWADYGTGAGGGGTLSATVDGGGVWTGINDATTGTTYDLTKVKTLKKINLKTATNLAITTSAGNVVFTDIDVSELDACSFRLENTGANPLNQFEIAHKVHPDQSQYGILYNAGFQTPQGLIVGADNLPVTIAGGVGEFILDCAHINILRLTCRAGVGATTINGFLFAKG